MLGDIQDVYPGDVRGFHQRGESSPILRVLGGAGADAVSVWRSVCRLGGFLGDGGAGGLLVGDGFVLGAGGEQRVSLGRGGVCHEWAAGIAVQAWTAGCSPIRGHPRRCRRKAPSTGRTATTPAPSSPVESSALSSLTPAPRLARCHLPSWPTAGLGKPGICAPSTARYGCGGPGGLVTVELADMLPTAMMTSSSGSPLPARTRVPSRKPSCCTRTPSGIWASPVATPA